MRIRKCPKCKGELYIFETKWDKPISLKCKKCGKVIDLKRKDTRVLDKQGKIHKVVEV